MKKTTQLQKIEAKIQKVKEKLVAIDEMRPGSISRQYNVCGSPNCRCKDKVNPKKHGPYYQLSYTHKGKSTTEFVKKDEVAAVKRQIRNYRMFKKLIEEWVDLSVKIGKLRKKTSTS